MGDAWEFDRKVAPEDSRPVGPAGHCTYCSTPIGGDHREDCVILSGRKYDAAPREWLPFETYVAGHHALFYFAHGERGSGGMETGMMFPDHDGTYSPTAWSHGGPNSGLDFDFTNGEMPSHWMPLPNPPAA